MSTPVRFLPVNHEEEVLTSQNCCGPGVQRIPSKQ